MKIVVGHSVQEAHSSMCHELSRAEDLEVSFPEPGYGAFVRCMREIQPEVVLTTEPQIAAATLALPQLEDECLAPHKRVVVTTSYSPMLLVVAAQAGFDEVIDISQPIETVVTQLIGVARGNRSLRSNPILKLLDYPLDLSHAEVFYGDKTDEQIVALVAAGLSDREIADLVYLSCQTVRNRVSKLLEGCGLRNRTQLALLYTRRACRSTMESCRWFYRW